MADSLLATPTTTHNTHVVTRIVVKNESSSFVRIEVNMGFLVYA